MASVSCEALCSRGSSFQMLLQRSSPPSVDFCTCAVFKGTGCHGLNSKMGSCKKKKGVCVCEEKDEEDVMSFPLHALYIQGASLSAQLCVQWRPA